MFETAAQRARWLVLVLMIMVGCGAATPAPPEQSTPDLSTAAPPATETQVMPIASPTTVGVPAAHPLLPQPVQFQSTDGTKIAALYWPPTVSPAPGIVLMHMMGGSKSDWNQFAALLQGASIAHAGAPSAGTVSFAVLAIDFRGHGGSGGTRDTQAMQGDAQAALSYIQGIPDVDKTRVVMIGASIGGDAAVDACTDGCIGAISLSPGGFLGAPYNDALKALGSKPVLCVASAGDKPSADTCTQGESVGLTDYQVQIYQGSAHGTTMFGIQDQKPLLTDLLFAWLRGHVS